MKVTMRTHDWLMIARGFELVADDMTTNRLIIDSVKANVTASNGDHSVTIELDQKQVDWLIPLAGTGIRFAIEEGA